MKTFLFLTLLSLFGKNLSEKEISYRQLTWADFRGPVPSSEPTVGARSTCGLDMPIETCGDIHHFAVKAYFLPYSSFVRERTVENLRHEQTHFKIAQIAALTCVREIQSFQGGDAADSAKAQDVYSRCFADMEQVNTRFDLESHHHLDTAGERKWEDKISAELRSLETEQKNQHGRNQ